MSFLTVSNTRDLERCFATIKELRPHLDFETYANIYAKAHQNESYEIVAIEEDGKIRAVMGYRFIHDFVRGKHLYVDDLVTAEGSRSQGYGARLLEYAEQIAREEHCTSLRLCTGVDNKNAMRFYEREGWAQRSVAYVKKF